MPYDGDLSELGSGASNDPDDPAHAHEFGEGGISQAHASRLADEILADPHTAPPSNGVKPGPRRNRHLDGFGGRNNA
jgi:hypothetical protein